MPHPHPQPNPQPPLTPPTPSTPHPNPTHPDTPLVPHICVSELVSIGSGNGLSPLRRQAITWTNTGLLSIILLGTYFREIWILSFSLEKKHLKMSSAEMVAIMSRGDKLTGVSLGTKQSFLSLEQTGRSCMNMLKRHRLRKWPSCVPHWQVMGADNIPYYFTKCQKRNIRVDLRLAWRTGKITLQMFYGFYIFSYLTPMPKMEDGNWTQPLISWRIQKPKPTLLLIFLISGCVGHSSSINTSNMIVIQWIWQIARKIWNVLAMTL